MRYPTGVQDQPTERRPRALVIDTALEAGNLLVQRPSDEVRPGWGCVGLGEDRAARLRDEPHPLSVSPVEQELHISDLGHLSHGNFKTHAALPPLTREGQNRWVGAMARLQTARPPMRCTSLSACEPSSALRSAADGDWGAASFGRRTPPDTISHPSPAGESGVRCLLLASVRGSPRPSIGRCTAF